MYPFNNQCSPHIESSWLICFANEMTHFDMMGTLVVKEINKIYFREKGIKKPFKAFNNQRILKDNANLFFLTPVWQVF